MSEAIEFDAEVYKVQTMPSDQCIRVTLELPETSINIMAMLAECRQRGIYLHFVATNGNLDRGVIADGRARRTRKTKTGERS